MTVRDIPKDICQALILRIDRGKSPSEQDTGLVYEDTDVRVTGVLEDTVTVGAKSSYDFIVYVGPLAKSVHGAMAERVQRDREWQTIARESAIREALGIK